MDDLYLLNLIKEHEGLKLYCYKDSLGYETIGYGRCIDKRLECGITQEEADFLLKNDVKKCESELSEFSWYQILDEVRQGVLIELCFNVGIMSLLEFHTMLSLIKEGKYKEASDDLLHTLWAKEVGSLRSENISHRLSTGTYKI